MPDLGKFLASEYPDTLGELTRVQHALIETARLFNDSFLETADEQKIHGWFYVLPKIEPLRKDWFSPSTQAMCLLAVKAILEFGALTDDTLGVGADYKPFDITRSPSESTIFTYTGRSDPSAASHISNRVFRFP